MMGQVSWIAVDWGTSRLRVWAMSSLGQVLDNTESDQGAGSLQSSEFEPALLALIDPWLCGEASMPVLICGMAGSRQGWLEAPYISLPAKLSDVACRAVSVQTGDERLSVSILPGLCQRDPSSPDVIRGEETQLLGLANAMPNFSGQVCLPGTHSKWVELDQGKILSSKTYMTGELYKLLSTQSILRHSVGGSTSWSETGFAEGVRKGSFDNHSFAADLFPIRAHGLLFGADADRAAAYLSGLVIGTEISAELGTNPLGKTIIIGAQKLADHYRTAFGIVGADAELIDAGELTLLGLSTAHKLTEQTCDKLRDPV
ncbi:MAG: 2-dehydro-3-deoxygalactonokinase [Stappiaceae bacterium]